MTSPPSAATPHYKYDEYFYVINNVYGNDEKTVGINVHMVIEESQILSKPCSW